MPDPNSSPAARYVRRFADPPGGETTDAQLLGRVVAGRDEAAFEVLVRRHGPKVLGICRRVLRHEHDAEDAFQATFLMFVREAAAIGRREAVGSWLYRVAFRTALRARVLAGRRAAREGALPDVPAPEETPDAVWADLRLVLDEEISRLPAKYRGPFVLCYVDGKTNEEAARELGWPKGTVLSRLAWARERLRGRLTRRGLALSGGFLVAGLVPGAAAAIPPVLVDSTLKAAAGAAVPAPVAALVKGASQAMFWTKGAILAACVLAAGAVGVGGVLGQRTGEPATVVGGAAEGQPGKLAEPGQPPAKPNLPKAAPKTYELKFQAASWADVFLWYSNISGLPFVGTSRPAGTVTIVPPGKRQYTLEEVTDLLNEALMPQKFILVRRPTSFTVLPVDEKIDRTNLPRVTLDELDKRARTELVTVAVPLTTVEAKDLAPDVQKMLGPFGEAVALEKANQLLISDTAGNLRLIVRMVKEVEDRRRTRAEPKK
jgi:RNA polymerase sigma factor (sigma-70 family)